MISKTQEITARHKKLEPEQETMTNKDMTAAGEVIVGVCLYLHRIHTYLDQLLQNNSWNLREHMEHMRSIWEHGKPAPF